MSKKCFRLYQSNVYSSRIVFCDKPHLEPNTRWIGWPLAEKWPFEIIKIVAGGHLRFGPPGSSAVRSSVTLCEQTLTDTIKLAHPKTAWVQESGIYLVSRLTYNQLHVEIRKFSLHSNRGRSVQSLADTFKRPTFNTSDWVQVAGLSLVQVQL